MLSKLWQKERYESPAQVSGQALLAKSLEMKNRNIVKFYKKNFKFYDITAILLIWHIINLEYLVPQVVGPKLKKYSFQIFVSDNAL